MNKERSSLGVVKRGMTVFDIFKLCVYVWARYRPGFWSLVQRMRGETDWCITVKTPCGPARLVFNPRYTSELTVVDELLPGDIYMAQRKAAHFVDCGAFRGISAIYLQDQVKATHVTAFEPQEDNFEILSRRLAKYLPGATCVNAAVGPKNGEVMFSGGGVGGSVCAEGNLVRMLRLRDEISASDAGLLLKMDIEGAEREVLPDLLPVLPQECLFFLETHFPEEPSKALVDLCREAGFAAKECRRREEDGSDVLFIDWELQRS